MRIFQLFNQLNKGKFSNLLSGIVVLGVSTSVLLSNTSANAAEQVVLKYGSFQKPISVQELNQFVETGKTTPTLDAYLQIAKQDPKLARKALKDGLKVNPALLDSLLSGWTGPILVDQIGEVVHPPTKPLDKQALRSALSASISQDNQVTLLGAIRNYPDATVELEGERIIPVYQRLSNLAKIL